MTQNAPSPIDTLDFQFKLQCRLKIFQNEDSSEFNSSYNLVAVASKYNLLFVGTNTPYIQVIQLRNLQKYIAKDGEIKDYLRRNISLPSRPQHLSVNCTCTTLCVIVEKDGCTKVIAYDVASFLKQDIFIIQEIRLSPTPGIKAIDASWNPAVPSMYAVCKANGSAGVYDLKESNIELNELPEIAAATCLCWSPKGKQIAIGGRDGKIIQYKPDLKVAKVINGPPLDGSQFPVSLQWISNYQFIAIYKSNSPDGQYNVFVINCPKGGDVTYINYEDICYSYGTARPCQFYMMYQNIWNILMVASSNSMEVGLLGFENDTWTQWILADAARAELPLSTANQDTLPIGLSLDTSSTHRLSWGETSLSPMPVLLLLSHHGVLCCFHAINLKPDASQICQAPENLNENNSAHLYFTTAEKSEIISSKPPEIKSTEQMLGSLPPQTTAFAFTFNPQQKPIATISQSQKSIDGMPPPQKPIIAIPQPHKPVSTISQPQKPIPTMSNVHSIQISKPEVNPKYIGGVNPNNSAMESLINSVNNKVHSEQTSDQKINIEKTRIPQIIPKIPPNSEIISTRNTISNNEDTEALVAQMIKEECAMLESELKILLQHGRSIHIELGTDNEATNLIQNTNTLQKFLDELNEISQTQSAEITHLKQVLLQTWALYEEARSRFATSKDPTLTTLILVQPLDAVSLRQLEEIHLLFYYLGSQLKQANIALDEQWESFQDSCKKKLNFKLPNIETIYQTMVKQNATIQKQVYIMKDISTRIRSKLRISTVPHLLLSFDNNKLEEQLQTLYIDSKDCFQLQYEKILDKQKRLTYSKSKKLRNLFEKRRIVHISLQKPRVINSTTSLSALVSAPFSPIVSSKKLHPHKLNFVQSTPKPVDSNVSIEKSEKLQVELVSNANQPNIQQKTQETKSLSNQNKSIFSISSMMSKEVSTPNANIFGFGETSATSAFVPTAQNIFTKNSLFNVNTTTGGSVNKQDLISSNVPQKSTGSLSISVTSPLFPIASTSVNVTLGSTFSTPLSSININSTAKQAFATEPLNIVVPTTKFVFSGTSNTSTPFVSSISSVQTEPTTAFNFSNLSTSKFENTATSTVSNVNTKSIFSNIVPKVTESVNSTAATTSKTVFPFGPAASTGNTITMTFNEKSFNMSPATIESSKPSTASTISTSNAVIPTKTNVETTETIRQVTPFATNTTSIFNISSLSDKMKPTALSEVITPTTETKTDILPSDQNKKTDLISPNKLPKDICPTSIESKLSIFNAPTSTTIASAGTGTTNISTSSSISTSSTAATTTISTSSGIFSKVPAGTTIFTQHSTGSIFSTTQAAPALVNEEQTASSIFGGSQKSVPVGSNNSIFKSSQVFDTPQSSTFEINQSTATTPSTIPSFNTISSPINKSFNTTDVSRTESSSLISSGTGTTSVNQPFTSNSTPDPRKPSVFETTTTENSIFNSSNTPDTSGNVFGASTLKSTFPTLKTSTNNAFETASSTFTSTSNPSFFNPSTSTSSLFGQSTSFSPNSPFNSPTSTNSGNIFGGTPSITTNIFGNTPSSSFATSNSNTPFGSVFARPSDSRPFTSTNDSFHFSLDNSTSNTSTNEESFGFNKPFTTFATNSSGTDKTSLNFGNFTVSTTSSGFGSGFSQNPFSRTTTQEQPKSPFSNTSIFGSPTSTPSTNIFGGNTSFNKSTPAFGGPPTFGQGSPFGQTGFGANSNAFSGSSQASPFSGSSTVPNQIGFGGSPVFGSTPTFGSTSPGGFGGPPNFGSTTSFGMNSNFNSPNKLFASTSSDTFGSSTQQNSTFANLANQPTVGFGNLAQQSQPPTSQSNFSGGSSFSTWR